MINVENEIFNAVAKAVRVSYPSVCISGEYIRIPSKFPFVSLIDVKYSFSMLHIPRVTVPFFVVVCDNS